jgi:hypothetical protein
VLVMICTVRILRCSLYMQMRINKYAKLGVMSVTLKVTKLKISVKNIVTKLTMMSALISNLTVREG